MRIAMTILLALLCSGAVHANPLAGTWKSDRELTLARLAVDKVPERHRKTIIEEADLGNAVIVFRANDYVWTLGDKERTLPYRILSVEGSFVEMEYFQHRAQTSPRTKRLYVTPELLYLPIGEFNFYEVFRRVDVPASPR